MPPLAAWPVFGANFSLAFETLLNISQRMFGFDNPSSWPLRFEGSRSGLYSKNKTQVSVLDRSMQIDGHQSVLTCASDMKQDVRFSLYPEIPSASIHRSYRRFERNVVCYHIRQNIVVKNFIPNSFFGAR